MSNEAEANSCYTRIKNVVDRYNFLVQEVKKFESFQNMSPIEYSAITITKHHRDDGSFDPRRRNQQVMFTQFSDLTGEAFNAFLNKHISSLKHEVSELERTMKVLNDGILNC